RARRAAVARSALPSHAPAPPVFGQEPEPAGASRSKDGVMSGEAESAFQEFQAHGRPRAMARVFDHTAQELLLVAANLARSGEEATELVQETFLVAMQQRARWDGERPLLPWLFGILLQLRRAERRRRASAEGRVAELEL